MSQAPYPPAGYAYGPGQGYQPGQPQVGFAPQQGYGPPPPQQGYAPPPPQQGYAPPPPQQQGSYGSIKLAFDESLATTTHMPLTKKPEESGYQIGLTVAQLICKDKLQGSAMIDLLSSSAELDPEGRVDRPTYTGSDVPPQDVFDNQFAKAPTPPAPPSDMFAPYSGYENTHFGSSFVPPPPPYVPPPDSQMPEQQFNQSTAITDNQARDAMLQFVSEHCCYGKAPAQEMQIKDIIPSSAYHYSLTSFCESRKTEWKYEPYQGQPIDSPVNGPPPLPWNIPVQPQQMFSDSQTKVEVPHTANIKPCHDCMAVGYKRCYKCCGRGRLRCSTCQGSGLVEGMERREQCRMCFGRGWKMCDVCNGHGRVKCWTCLGNAQLKTFIEMTVKWENHVSNHVVGRTDQLPDELIVKSEGTEIFSQELPRVWPITNFFDQQVNMGSKRLVDEHSNKWPAKRILLQRQVLRAVPVSEVHYQWKELSSRFWVYGHDHKVYAPDYPQKCCCGCSIL